MGSCRLLIVSRGFRLVKSCLEPFDPIGQTFVFGVFHLQDSFRYAYEQKDSKTSYSGLLNRIILFANFPLKS